MAFRRLLPRLPVARAALNSAVRKRGRTCEVGSSYEPTLMGWLAGNCV